MAGFLSAFTHYVALFSQLELRPPLKKRDRFTAAAYDGQAKAFGHYSPIRTEEKR